MVRHEYIVFVLSAPCVGGCVRRLDPAVDREAHPGLLDYIRLRSDPRRLKREPEPMPPRVTHGRGRNTITAGVRAQGEHRIATPCDVAERDARAQFFQPGDHAVAYR